ncbi:MAG TPA: hypothetical protein DGF10_09555 [Acidimicrobiaceae bacterium]|nr:hypothetical protein [Acidimicrobiaceae bacterium]HCV34897.1 hypothetical protein [Acidimicrobiaceae bacterium]
MERQTVADCLQDPDELELESALEALGLIEGVRRDYPIGPLTTYRVGGTAAWFVRPVNETELAAVATVAGQALVPVLLLGRGSNLLVSDTGFSGLAIQLGAGFEGVDLEGTEVVAGGGASLPVVARLTVASGLAGFEWAVGVPGSIGGAVRMNAGGHGSDMSRSLVAATVLHLSDGSTVERTADELNLGYRTSTLEPGEIVVSVRLALEPGDRLDGEARLSEVVRWRRENQPGGQNAGSVFTNPDGDSAGRLVELAGCRGLRLGTAEVSSRHANFIQADEGGSADDVAALMTEVARQVAEVHGVDLVPETVMVGFE